MREFKGKVAVVTGAASGIGLGLAERCALEGMKVVLADVEKDALARAEKGMKAQGAEALAVAADVSKLDDVELLARRAKEAFGGVHLLFNNAGVGAGGFLWESTTNDWQWVLGVNLWGLAHAIRVFIPLMLSQRTACHVVNTASAAGLVSGPGMGIYNATKHAIVGISETLYQELALAGADVGVSVLCPGWVKTRILEQERNRPEEYRNPPRPSAPGHRAVELMMRREIEKGMAPEEVAEKVFQAIREKRLYVLTHPELKDAIRRRMTDILEERNPVPPAPPI
jgi:NAD(P)-dependent dehydrogenase (short-subunit alcohol dehydrogenase family)